MKVTGIIKDAITAQVKAIAKPTVDALDEEIRDFEEKKDRALKMVQNKLKNDILKATENSLVEIIRDNLDLSPYREQHAYYENKKANTIKGVVELYGQDFSTSNLVVYRPDKEKDLMKQKDDLNYKINHTINDIIIQLELGGNKATLDKLLKNVSF